MPLFMDFHKIEKVTIEDVKKAHMADHAIQEQYGVKYHQFWVNQEAGTVFCLTEGPDRETCEKVHQLAHGNIACAMTEVEPGYYKILMGERPRIDHGLVQHEDGSVDLGYRSILVASLQGHTKATSSRDLQNLLTPNWARKLVFQKIEQFKGREVKWATDDSLIGVFNDSTLAVRCAHQIQRDIEETEDLIPQVNFRIGISADQPVTENGEFFERAIKLAHRLSTIAQPNQICISSLVENLCQDEELTNKHPHVKSINSSDEDFVSTLFTITENNLGNEEFTIELLSRNIGVSRPQLYRKITTLTGRSPHDLLRDLRMEKALTLLKRKKGNISEIAMEVGYNNASYFAKCFAEKFGCKPSEFAISAV